MSTASLSLPQLEELPVNKNYSLIKVIGKGTYSTVYLSCQSSFDVPDLFDDTPKEDVVSQISEDLQHLPNHEESHESILDND